MRNWEMWVIGALISLLLIVGCWAVDDRIRSGVLSPTLTHDIADERQSKATLIFRDAGSSLYAIEYKDMTVLHNSKGGVAIMRKEPKGE